MMTTENARDLLQVQWERTVEGLEDLDPQDPLYSQLVDTLQRIDKVLARLETDLRMTEWARAGDEDIAACQATEPNKEDTPEEETAPAPAEDPAPEEPSPAPEEEKVDRPALRAALAEAKGKGINIRDLLATVGSGNFSAVPDHKLGELKAKLNEALKELGQ